MEIDDSVAHTGDKSLKVVGIAATGVPYNARIHQGGISVQDDQIFSVTFWAKVDATEGGSREVEVNARMDIEPWSGFHWDTIILDSTDWKEYSHTFAVKTDEPGEMWIGLSIADSDVDFWIDDVGLFHGGPPDEIERIEMAVRPADKLPTSWGSIKSHFP